MQRRMALVLALAILGFAAVGALVGGRLLALAHRTGAWPERLVGVGLVSYAVVCQPTLLVLGAVGRTLAPGAQLALTGLVTLTAAVTVCCIYAFTWLVFRRHETWARALLAAGVGVAILSGVLAMLDPTSVWSAVRAGNFVLGFAWAGAESLRYHGLLRRRAALGMADPALRNRFLVWGASMSLAAALTLPVVLLAAVGQQIGTHPLPTLFAVVNTCVNAIGWWLTFLPPAWYRRRVAGAPAPA